MEIEFSKKAEKLFSKLNPRIQRHIIEAIEKFKKVERIDIKKLKGEDNFYRVRVGEYRFTMKKLEPNKWLVTFIGKRENFYEL